MQACWRWLARVALVAHLACVHLALFRLWYASGLRNMFTRKENVHVEDLMLAMRIAEGDVGSDLKAVYGGGDGKPAPLLPVTNRLALLFMLRGRLELLEAWKLWLDPERDKRSPRISLYFHLADRGLAPDAAIDGEIAALSSLPGFRQVLPTVATGWCELVAAQVALLRAALADDSSTELFVFLPHDSVPFAPFGVTLATLMGPVLGAPDAAPRTRICPAGVRGLDVPFDCPHGIEPHWSRSLLLKHHQWMALNRAHASRLSDPVALRVAVAIFQELYLGEPLCSDEVLPLLALAIPEAILETERLRNATSRDVEPPHLIDLPLYAGATWGLGGFEAELRAMGAAQECILYAPWPGCHMRQKGGNKRARSPVVGGGLAPQERDVLIGELARQGVLFGRKLGMAGGSASDHMKLIVSATVAVGGGGVLPIAPHRLLPELDIATTATWLKWGLACVEAGVPLHFQVAGAIAVAALAGWGAVAGQGIGRKYMKLLFSVYVAVHCVVFFLSVALFAEYSLLEPFKRLGRVAKAEM
mmetsp:Transcript_29129/g.96741  ORF Transcript_29129/g.96741 Transcript_29129/m.96741 type:complete len:531 (+) Transcript_29129:47-1639(+)